MGINFKELIKLYRKILKSEEEQKIHKTVHFQTDNDPRKVIVSSSTNNNQVQCIHFSTQNEASERIWEAIQDKYSLDNGRGLIPFWDVRYTNPVLKILENDTNYNLPDWWRYCGIDARKNNKNVVYASKKAAKSQNGTLVSSRYLGSLLSGGCILDLSDVPKQKLTYAGIAATFIYQFHPFRSSIAPWAEWGSEKGNLVLQTFTNSPLYLNYENNFGGNISFNVFLFNKKRKLNLNYVITMYSYGKGWMEEQKELKFDPTTRTVHIPTVVKNGTVWSTKSSHSNEIKYIKSTYDTKTVFDKDDVSEFYRVNISYDDLKTVLEELKRNPPKGVEGKDFGTNPAEWTVTLVGIQHELEESGGKAILAMAFKGFEVYSTPDPM